MSPVQIEDGSDRCGAVREKGDPRTHDTFVFVCDKPAGHVYAGDLYHEGDAGVGTNRLAWPADQAERRAS